MDECKDPNHIHGRNGDRWHSAKAPLVTSDGQPYHDKNGNPIIYAAVSLCPITAERELARRQEQSALLNRKEDWWSK